jgi:ectoine hydroxylase-related dioxygenase (phytanoyl-CoA dioxygenase family)
VTDTDTAYALTSEDRDAFRRDGHAVLRGVLSRETIERLRPIVRDAFDRQRGPAVPLDARRSAYERAFVQVVNASERAPEIRTLTRSARLGRLAAELLGVSGVRLFVEDMLFKEPGGGRTPWHQDASTLPLAPPLRMITVWVPLVDVPDDAGRLTFMSGSHRLGLLGPVDISEETDAAFERLRVEHGLPVVTSPAMHAGDVSVHDGGTVHGALANESGVMREVVALHFFADGMRVAAADNEARARLLAHFAPHLAPGDLAAGPLWPLVWPRD